MEAKDRLMELYRLAVANGVVKNRNGFAELVNTAEATLSNSLNGVPKYAGTAATLVIRAEAELMKRGISVVAKGDAAGRDLQKNDCISNPDIKEIVNTLVQELAAQREANSMILAQKDAHIDRLLTMIEKMNS